MAITYDFRKRTDSDYKEQRYLVMLWVEQTGSVAYIPYTDNPSKGGYATIGVGFKIDSNWKEILDTFGFDTRPIAPAAEKSYIQQLKALVGTNHLFTGTQMSTLIAQLNAVMFSRYSYYANVYQDYTKRQIFAFNDSDEVKSTFQQIADRNEAVLSSWLGETDMYSIVPQGNERIVLLSLFYNNIVGPGKSPSLLQAIKNGNRAEAWFEIRYNSNAASQAANIRTGLAKRRYYESDYFGLYNNNDPNSVNETEAKTVMRMYTLHKKKIDDYDRAFSNQVAAANSAYHVTWVKTLADDLDIAKSYLIANFATNIGMSIDGEVIVGAGLDSYSYKEGNDVNDSGNKALKGGSKGDLIFGEKGNDELIGNGGNDVIYGGDGDDTITGGIGDDYLIGGIGDDTYIYNIGDGNDWIYDEDKKGKIVVKNGNTTGEQKIGTVYKPTNGANIWETPNGVIHITHNSPWQIVLEDGGTIQLGEDFESGDFGINLLDTPTDPVTTNTIVCDNQHSFFNDTAANDKIIGTGDSDAIDMHSGGNDWVLGNSGTDLLNASESVAGNVILEGGEGNDLLFGGAGDDKIFAGSYGQMDDLVTAGETAENIMAWGEVLSGGAGDDFVYGSNSYDKMTGGLGNDLIVGGGGNKDSVQRIAWSVEKRNKAKLQGVCLNANRSPLYANYEGGIHA